MPFYVWMFNFPIVFLLFEQFLVSSQSSAQPHTEGGGAGQGRCQHLVIPTKQLELPQEALGLHGNVSWGSAYPGTKESFSLEVPLLLHRPNTNCPLTSLHTWGVFTNQRWHLVSHQALIRKLSWDSAFLTLHPAAEREINLYNCMITCQTSIRSRRQLWAAVFMGNAWHFLWFLAFKGSKVQMLVWNQSTDASMKSKAKYLENWNM